VGLVWKLSPVPESVLEEGRERARLSKLETGAAQG